MMSERQMMAWRDSLITHRSSQARREKFAPKDYFLEILHPEAARRQILLLHEFATDHVAQGFGGAATETAVTCAAEKCDSGNSSVKP